jgi:hypothetical protein
MPPVTTASNDDVYTAEAKNLNLDLDARNAIVQEVSTYVNGLPDAEGTANVYYGGQHYHVTYKYDDAEQELTCTGITHFTGTAPKITPTGKPDQPTTSNTSTAAAKKLEILAAFLEKHSLADEGVLNALKKCGISSLQDLLWAKADQAVRKKVQTELDASGGLFGRRRFDDLRGPAIENAIFFAANPDAEKTAGLLIDFLADNDVLPSSAHSNKHKLLSILLKYDVKSLPDLQRVMDKAPDQQKKLTNLTAAIKEWNRGAGDSFENLTPAAVARAASGAPQEANEELKAFLSKKAKLPPGSEKVLTDFGITTLEQLKAVKEDSVRSAELQRKLDNSGILNARKAFDGMTVASIEEEIGAVNSPAKIASKKKSAELTAAIEQVKALRTKVESATKENFAAVRATVASEYDAVLSRIKDISGAEFDNAQKAAEQSQTDLKTLLDSTIQNAEKANSLLDSIDTAERPLTTLINGLEMLCGVLISPAGVIRKYAELVRMPEMPDQLAKAPEAQQSTTLQYKGRTTNSFASSYASQTGSAISTSVEAAGATFVGSGLAAVSAAASYSDAKKASEDEENFQSATTATCGEIRYLFSPQKTVQFKAKEIRLTDTAGQELASIAALPNRASQIDKIKAFYDAFGSHFFTRYSLGGRYEFKATGETLSTAGKAKLVSTVSAGTNWAASASGSYLGMGGAVTTAASVIGSTTMAQARGDRLEFTTDSAKVEVSINVLGGAGIAPRDIWAQSLRYNSTWAVISREQPIPLWAIVQQDANAPSSVKDMAPLLQEVWVREVFRNAVRESDPILYSRIQRDDRIKTCESLTEVVQQLQKAEPDLEIVIVEQISQEVEHPKATAQTTLPGLKLIGGGARADFPQGRPGTLLTGSYPSGNGWVASGKSHKYSSLGKIVAYAIYLVDPDDLWDVQRVEAKSKDASNRPEATATLPPGYALTGGGAFVEYLQGQGILLTTCGPAVGPDGVCTGWTAKGKDHEIGDNGYATAWVFGIRPRNMKKGTNPKASYVFSETAQGSHVMRRCGVNDQQVAVGGGALVTTRGAGGLLTATYPDQGATGWGVLAKDHGIPDTLDVTIWSIARTGKFRTVESISAARAGR